MGRNGVDSTEEHVLAPCQDAEKISRSDLGVQWIWFQSVNIRGGFVIAENARLTAFVQCQLRLDRIAQANIEVAAVGKVEIHLWAVVAILVDRRPANHLADEFFTVDHTISRLEWSHENISVTLEWRILS